MFLSSVFGRYKKDEKGQYAILTAVLAMPLLLGTSAAMDFSKASSEHKAVKSALDTAVLAAATTNDISNAEKIQIAETQFLQNYSGRVNMTAKATIIGDRVEMVAKGVMLYSLSDSLGLNGIEIEAKSVAARSEGSVVCVLALSQKEDAAINFSGGLEFLAPSCSVHSNSISPTALISESSKTPIAKSFCATGGANGNFSPYAKGQCLPLEDPYLNVEQPRIGQCISDKVFSDDEVTDENEDHAGRVAKEINWDCKKPSHRHHPDYAANANSNLGEGELIEQSENRTGSRVIFSPGTYCGGLTVDGTQVTFLPGDYIMLDGALTFKNGAQARAKDVTFAFSGEQSRLVIESGADVTVKAPETGPRKGLAFMEMKPVNVIANAVANDEKESEQIANTISGGGRLSVVGTVYFPTQALVVEGEGTQMGAKSPATSFIAHTVDLKGSSGSRVRVHTDHDRADLPPLLPRAEDGAILIE